jgi:hypothetical protein
MQLALRLRLTTKDPTTKMTCFWHELRDPHHYLAGEPLDVASLTCMSSSRPVVCTNFQGLETNTFFSASGVDQGTVQLYSEISSSANEQYSSTIRVIQSVDCMCAATR